MRIISISSLCIAAGIRIDGDDGQVERQILGKATPQLCRNETDGKSSNCNQLSAKENMPVSYTAADCAKQMEEVRGNTFNYGKRGGKVHCYVKSCISTDMKYIDNNGGWNVYSKYCAKQILGKASGPVYTKGIGGQNCPTDQVVASIDECKEAAIELGLPFKGLTKHRRPIGCFQMFGKWAQFNADFKAKPNEHWHSVGGICHKRAPIKAKVDGTSLTFRGCYSKESSFKNKSYGGDGGSLKGGVEAAKARGLEYVAIANNPSEGHRFAFKKLSGIPDLTAADCTKGCDDGSSIPCGCADNNNANKCDRAWAVWEIEA